MRIAKVALAFFSTGFLAGSFERAAGLGHANGGYTQQSRAVQERQVDAAVARGTMVVMASFASFGGGLPEELFASPLNPPDVPDAVAAALPDLVEEPKDRVEAVRPRVRPVCGAPRRRTIGI